MWYSSQPYVSLRLTWTNRGWRHYHITSHLIALHRITLHHITSHPIALYHIPSHRIASHRHWHRITLHHITSHRIASHRNASHHITSHHITSHHMSHHITSYHLVLHSNIRPTSIWVHISECNYCNISKLLFWHFQMRRINGKGSEARIKRVAKTAMVKLPETIKIDSAVARWIDGNNKAWGMVIGLQRILSQRSIHNLWAIWKACIALWWRGQQKKWQRWVTLQELFTCQLVKMWKLRNENSHTQMCKHNQIYSWSKKSPLPPCRNHTFSP